MSKCLQLHIIMSVDGNFMKCTIFTRLDNHLRTCQKLRQPFIRFKQKIKGKNEIKTASAANCQAKKYVRISSFDARYLLVIAICK